MAAGRLRNVAGPVMSVLVAMAVLGVGQARADGQFSPKPADRIGPDFTAPATPDWPFYFGPDMPATHASTGGWRIETTMWAWMSGVSGDVGARDQTAHVDADFIDILNDTNSIIGIAGRVEVGKGRWAGFVDGLYTKMQANNQSGPRGRADVDVTFKQTLIDFGLMYRLGEWAPHGDAARNGRDTTLDAYAGGRYQHLEIKLNPARLNSASRSDDWCDPIIGAKLVLPLAEHWHASVNGDVGGFGVASDFTWSATGVLGYDFTLFNKPATFYLGYRAIGDNFTDGSSANQFKWDVVMHGPLIGFGIKW